MAERALPVYLYSCPEDHEITEKLGTALRFQRLELSWERDEQAERLGVNIHDPEAEVYGFLWSLNALQYGTTTGFPGRTATADNYLLILLDGQAPPVNGMGITVLI